MGKLYTMVSKIGDVKLTLEYMHFLLIDEEYNIKKINGNELKKLILGKKIEVTNMDVNTKKNLVISNGASNRYTLYDNDGKLVGDRSAVVLNRIEKSGSLIGYTLFNIDGEIVEVGIKKAVEMHKSGLIANSKVRQTEKGEIIQSINGDYRLRKVLDLRRKKEEVIQKLEVSMDILFCSSIVSNGKEIDRYIGIVFNTNSALGYGTLVGKVELMNNKLKGKIGKVVTDGYLETLEIKKTGGYGVYGVIRYSDAKELFKKNKVTNKLDSFMFSVIDYENENTEYLYMIDNKLGVKRMSEGIPEEVNIISMKIHRELKNDLIKVLVK